MKTGLYLDKFYKCISVPNKQPAASLSKKHLFRGEEYKWYTCSIVFR